jgi:hypothetical protein
VEGGGIRGGRVYTLTFAKEIPARKKTIYGLTHEQHVK